MKYNSRRYPAACGGVVHSFNFIDVKLIWLSHVIDQSTPSYGGADDIAFRPVRRIKNGDTCNTSRLTISSHTGTHIDAPFHFIDDGKSIVDYPPETWVFNYPQLLDISVQPGELIDPQTLPSDVPMNHQVDFVLLRTGFEQYRNDELYWKNGPGIAPSMASDLKKFYPSFRASGVSFFSISSLCHREGGRKAHKAFLEQSVLLFEDLSLKEIRNAKGKTKGIIGVNIMVAMSNFADLVKTAISEKADIIFSGAGLPLDLPKFLNPDSKTKLVP
ncbi:hypothetical protein D4S03_02000, partial [bacterium]